MGLRSRLLLMATMGGAMVASASVASAETISITHDGVSIEMDFVTIRDPGNAGDTEVMTDDTTGYGSVSYEYRIGKYEVSQTQWEKVVDADTGDLLNDPGYWMNGSLPVTNISWHEAAMFCNWLTSGDVTLGAYAINGSGVVTGIDRAAAVTTYGTVYVLPTEDEWYKAAYYDPNKDGAGSAGYWDYPTQDDDPYPPDGLDSPGDPDFDAVFNDGHNSYEPYGITGACSVSAYGTYGQGGNVSEWNETLIVFNDNFYRGERGGHHMSLCNDLHASARGSNSPTSGYWLRGFRVAISEGTGEVVPEPGCIVGLISMGLMGALGLWRRRKRAA